MMDRGLVCCCFIEPSIILSEGRDMILVPAELLSQGTWHAVDPCLLGCNHGCREQKKTGFLMQLFDIS